MVILTITMEHTVGIIHHIIIGMTHTDTGIEVKFTFMKMVNQILSEQHLQDLLLVFKSQMTC